MLVPLLSGCVAASGATYQEGYYTAQAAALDAHGWKEYVTIYTSGERIVMVEYDARNAGGFIKSWDMDYMRNMNGRCGTYPNEYTRQYAASLLGRQDPQEVDVITGATHSHIYFQMLAEAAIEQAKAGDSAIAYVDLPIIEEEEADAPAEPAPGDGV